MGEHDWFPGATKVISPNRNPMAHNRPTRKATFHRQEGTGMSAVDLARYVIGKKGEYSIVVDAEGRVAQLYPFSGGARALLNGGIDGGLGCNRSGTRNVQLCATGYTAHGWQSEKQKQKCIEVAAFLAKHHGIPMRHAGDGSRSADRWLHHDGWFSHREAPGNDHTDAPPDWDWLHAPPTQHHGEHHAAPTDHPVGRRGGSSPSGSGRQGVHYVVEGVRGRVLNADGSGWTFDKGHATQHPGGRIREEHVADAVAYAQANGGLLRVLKAKPADQHPDHHGRTGGTLTKVASTEWPRKEVVERLKKVAEDLGREVRIVSGWRRTGHPGDLAKGNRGTQWYLYEGWQQRRPGFNLAAHPKGGGYPGSNHEGGWAADVDVVDDHGNLVSIGAYPGGQAALDRHGLWLSVRDSSGRILELWHTTPKGTHG